MDYITFDKLRKKNSKVARYTLQQMPDEEFKRLVKHVKLNTDSKIKGKKLARKLKNKRTPRKQDVNIPIVFKNSRPRENILLDDFAPERTNKWPKFNNRIRGHTINVRNFSFIDNPQETIKKLIEIAKAEYKYIDAHVDFYDDSLYDIAPYLIWGMMDKSMFPYYNQGRMAPLIKGVIKHVGIKNFSQNTYCPPVEGFEPLIVKQKEPFGKLNCYKKNFLFSTISKTSDELVHKINTWLHPAKKKLSIIGEQKLSGIVNEVLNNAERHASTETNRSSWVVAGVMLHNQKDEISQCFLSFINTGRSIAQSIKNADNEIIKTKLKNYINLHKGKDKKISEDTLATLYALQDTISSKKNYSDHKNGIGGIGLMDIIEFINILGKSNDPKNNPAITILSGKSCIIFKDEYCSVERPNIETEPRTKYFNINNDKNILPNNEYVFNLDENFPGTIITTRFYINNNITITEKPGAKK